MESGVPDSLVVCLRQGVPEVGRDGVGTATVVVAGERDGERIRAGRLEIDGTEGAVLQIRAPPAPDGQVEEGRDRGEGSGDDAGGRVPLADVVKEGGRDHAGWGAGRGCPTGDVERMALVDARLCPEEHGLGVREERGHPRLLGRRRPPGAHRAEEASDQMRRCAGAGHTASLTIQMIQLFMNRSASGTMNRSPNRMKNPNGATFA